MRDRRRALTAARCTAFPSRSRTSSTSRGTPTTAASRVRDAIMSRETDARSWRGCATAGAVFVGKTNLHEFALGTTNEDSAFGPARHPLDRHPVAGGSSGGSAASVLAGMAYASIGTDTGGSIRIPSAACGLVGLKPTLGEIPMRRRRPAERDAGPRRTDVPIGRGCGDPVRRPARRRSVRPARRASRSARGIRLGVLRGYFTRCSIPRWQRRSISACTRAARGRRRARGCQHPARRRYRADLSAHRPGRSGRVPCEDARKPARTTTRRTCACGSRWDGTSWPRTTCARCADATCCRMEVDAALEGCDGLLLPSLPVPAPTPGRRDRADRRDRGAGPQHHAATDPAVQHHRASRHHAAVRRDGRRAARSAHSSSARSAGTERAARGGRGGSSPVSSPAVSVGDLPEPRS